MCIPLLVIAGMVAFVEGVAAGVRAPLLTMIGGLIIVVVLFPARKPTFSDIGVILGTGIAVLGSYYWYKDEIPGKEGLNFFFVLLYIYVGIVVVLISIIYLVWFLVSFTRIANRHLRDLRARFSRSQSNSKNE